VFGNRIVGSEDCLYLNIWRPDTEERNLPVYVWIHGGGNSIGSAHQVSDFHGDAIADRSNLIFVSINYRLGPFGWFLHPSLDGSDVPDGSGGRNLPAEDNSGNYGTLDIIEALRWIQANIEAFGGDPSRVLIAGESAGAMNVLSLLLAPQASGLFTHAVIQSGLPRMESREAGEAIGLQLEAELLDDAAPPTHDIRAALTDFSGREILRVFKPGAFGMLRIPNIFADGHVMPENGYRAMEMGDYPSRVPVLIGSNQEEMKLFMASDRRLRRSPELYQAVTRHLSDDWKIDGVDSIARILTDGPDQPPVYAYHFRWGAPDEVGTSELPGRKGLWYGAFHSLEVPFFLGTGTIHGPLSFRFFRRSNSTGRGELTDAMMRYAASFLRTDSPNTGNADLPEWVNWSNLPGAAKSLILDYREGSLAIEMMNQEYTDASLRSLVELSYAPPIAAEVLRHLSDR
jgi:para-nitrobenzyl esterase